MKEPADISTESKVVMEKDLLDLRRDSLPEYRRTRLEIAVLSKTRRVSSRADLSILSTPIFLSHH